MADTMITVRKLTTEERAVWGVCPVCGACQGEKCDGEHWPTSWASLLDNTGKGSG